MIIIITIITSFFLISCTGSTIATNDSDSTIYTPKYAKRFTIQKRGEDTIVFNVINPWQGAKSTEKQYLIDNPYGRIIAMSTSHLAFLDALSYSDSVVGVSGKDYIYSKNFSSAEDIGYDKNLEFEKIMSLKPDVMFIYEVSGENDNTFKKLKNLGINAIYIGDYLEDSPLGRAEWIVAFGAMIGKLDEAITIFNNVENEYLSISNRAKLSLIGTKVMINSPYKNQWYLPGSDSYPIKLIQDAGGIYVAKDYKGNQSYPINTEIAYDFLQSADIWINPSIGIESKSDIISQNAIFKNITLPPLFNNNKRITLAGGTDYYELGVIRPGLILHDLSLIFSLKEKVPDDSLFFYRQLK